MHIASNCIDDHLETQKLCRRTRRNDLIAQTQQLSAPGTIASVFDDDNVERLVVSAQRHTSMTQQESLRSLASAAAVQSGAARPCICCAYCAPRSHAVPNHAFCAAPHQPRRSARPSVRPNHKTRSTLSYSQSVETASATVIRSCVARLLL